jgi:hypothetical protein
VTSTASAQSVVTAEVYAELLEAVGNITFTPSNRMIFSHHPFFEPETRVLELEADGKSARPFPNAKWNTPRPGTDRYFDSVLGLRGDETGVVWVLDMGNRTGLTPKIVGWNTWADRLQRIYYIPAPASIPESQHNDMIVNLKDRVFVIVDEGIGPGGDGTKAALVIVDMDTGAPIRVGVDGIAADVTYEWLYFGPLSGGTVYRVRFVDLLDEDLSEAELGKHIERYADKPNNGGLSMDIAGNLYLTEVETTAVGIIPADTRVYRRYAVADRMIWPHGVSFGPDGFM